MRRRIWSETLPFTALTEPATLALLARFRVELIAAVRPWDLPALPGLLGACNDAGVSVGLWPMIEDADGRWASASNAPRFTAFARRLLDALPPEALVRDLAIDLEPPFGVVATAMRSPTAVLPSVSSLHDAGWAAARREFRSLIGEVRDRGLQCSATVLPFVLLDPSTGPLRPVQRALSVPVDALPWDHVNVMLYTSLFEGWSGGLIRRTRAIDLLARGAAATRRRFGDSAGVSVGVVDVGALGDEPRYRDPSELAVDVAVSLSSGVDVINLFDLGGVLRRGPAEAWFEALSGA
ncbi:MAG: hypothetical protein IPN17_19410 [Deltaproteobacteria bacterium]|nr:hypothetical protein [Deltaproteobacteria bacterium]